MDFTEHKNKVGFSPFLAFVQQMPSFLKCLLKKEKGQAAKAAETKILSADLNAVEARPIKQDSLDSEQ